VVDRVNTFLTSSLIAMLNSVPVAHAARAQIWGTLRPMHTLPNWEHGLPRETRFSLTCTVTILSL